MCNLDTPATLFVVGMDLTNTGLWFPCGICCSHHFNDVSVRAQHYTNVRLRDTEPADTHNVPIGDQRRRLISVAAKCIADMTTTCYGNLIRSTLIRWRPCLMLSANRFLDCMHLGDMHTWLNTDPDATLGIGSHVMNNILRSNYYSLSASLIDVSAYYNISGAGGVSHHAATLDDYYLGSFSSIVDNLSAVLACGAAVSGYDINKSFV